MKNAAMYLLLLTGGIALSAWLGMSDAKSDALGSTGAQLNSSRRRGGLREGEVLVWDPNSQQPPPQAVAAPRQTYRGAAPIQSAPRPAAPIRQSAAPAPAGAESYYRATRKLVPLASPLPPPRRGEWRSQYDETDQGFTQFLGEARQRGGTLIVLPIGDLPPDQKRAIGHILDSMSAFFGLPAACATPLPLSSLPPECFRSAGGRRQLNAETLMHRVLRPNVGGDVAAILAITSLDLYPGEGWPFASAFGWSAFGQGTSVVSTAQSLDGGEAYRGRNLLRLCKLSVHELSHTFGLKHCSTYECLMNGCGSLAENDAKPLALCPDCLAKLSFATGRSPALHLEDMIGLCKAKGFGREHTMHARFARNLQ